MTAQARVRKSWKKQLSTAKSPKATAGDAEMQSASPATQPALSPRRLALPEREREVAPARTRVLDTGDLRHHTATGSEDVEELRVGELVLAIHVVEVSAEPGRP